MTRTLTPCVRLEYFQRDQDMKSKLVWTVQIWFPRVSAELTADNFLTFTKNKTKKPHQQQKTQPFCDYIEKKKKKKIKKRSNFALVMKKLILKKRRSDIVANAVEQEKESEQFCGHALMCNPLTHPHCHVLFWMKREFNSCDDVVHSTRLDYPLSPLHSIISIFMYLSACVCVCMRVWFRCECAYTVPP